MHSFSWHTTTRPPGKHLRQLTSIDRRIQLAATSNEPSRGASGAAPVPDGFHEFLQRRQPVTSGGEASAASGEHVASTRTSAGSAGDATAATSSTGPSAASATGGRIGLLAPFVPAVRDSPNYSAPPPLVPQRSDPASLVSSQQDEATTAGGAASSATPPSQPLPAGAAAATGNRVLVHPRQKGNVVLKHIRNVPWEYSDDIAPDFMVGQRNCVTFLSLRCVCTAHHPCLHSLRSVSNVSYLAHIVYSF